MRLLQIIGDTNTFQRCEEYARLIQSAILAHDNGRHSSGYHCFRCYHTLAAVTLVQLHQKGGE